MIQTEQVIQEVKKMIKGKDTSICKVFAAMLAGGHILIDDVPGVGKTTLAVAFSQAMQLENHRVQFTPDVLPADILGFSMYQKETGQHVYYPGAVICNLFLEDEINRTRPKTQSELLEVMEEGNVTVDGNTYEVPKPFVVISTQNPFGSAGTQLLPQSQLDRFMVKLEMGYPDFESQVNILKDRQEIQPLDTIKAVINKDDLEEMQMEVSRVKVKDEIVRYITRLAEATRSHEYIQLGVSPRGAYAVNNMAKASAYIAGRGYVTPEDVIGIFPSVSSHRVILHPKAKVTGVSAMSIMEEITKTVSVPEIS